MIGRFWTLVVLAACGGDPADEGCAYDHDDDGVCDDADACEGADDTVDADGDGVPDACELDLIGTWSNNFVPFETDSTVVEAWLVYNANGAVSTWEGFTPPLTITDADRGPVTAWTRDLSGWATLEGYLTDDKNQEISVRLVGVEDEATGLVREQEWDLGLKDLQEARINQVSFKVTQWEPGGTSMSYRWELRGVL